MRGTASPQERPTLRNPRGLRRVGPSGRGRWGTALGLAVVVLLLGAMDGFPLVALPLGVLLIGISARQRWWWLGLAVLVWALALTPGASGVHTVSRGWGLLLGGGFLAATLLRPRWYPFSRALVAVTTASIVAAGSVMLGGGWSRFDQATLDHFQSLSIYTSRELRVRFPDAEWAGHLAVMAARVADLQALLFPALLALQSLAALALVWWAFSRSRSRMRFAHRPALRPLREFRFHDGLIWIVIAGLFLVVVPLGDAVARAGYNLLLFMAALYILRGLAIFVFLARGAPVLTSVMLGAIVALFFYPLVFTAALLVGLGDTWLDVRGRVMAAASRA